MASANKKVSYGAVRTHEGGIASRVSKLEELKRSVLSTLLWEDGFYENGESIAERIFKLTQSVKQEEAIAVLLEAKEQQKLRHAPLLMLVAMTEKGWITKELVNRILTRVDDIPELLSLYWLDGKKPLDKQLKKGIDLALRKFNEYQFAKYNRPKAIKLRDVLRIVRPKPSTPEQADLWGKIVKGTLTPPDTWEVALSTGKDKKETFTRLIQEGKLGDLAFIRNLRKMQEVGVDKKLIMESMKNRKWGWMLPYQFVTAARYNPQIEESIEQAMLSCLSNIEKSGLSVALLVDDSGSMSSSVSAKSEARRIDVAAGLAIIAREMFTDIDIYKFDADVYKLPNRHGFALRDMFNADGGTEMWGAIKAAGKERHRNLMIVITDEQTSDEGKISDANADLLVIINVANDENGVGYGKGSVHISGWSENVLDYVQKYAKMEQIEA